MTTTPGDRDSPFIDKIWVSTTPGHARAPSEQLSSDKLLALRADVARLGKQIRAEKRAKGAHWHNSQCKDWGEYKTKRDLLRSVEEALANG